MQIHEIRRESPNKKSRRVGRGGIRGKTSGRGHKGQKQHGSHGMRPEIRDQIKKIPKLRGRGKNSLKSIKSNNIAINVSFIEKNFKDGAVVSPLHLLEEGFISQYVFKNADVKILGNGDLNKKVTVEGCLVSKSAEEKIIKAGGKILA
ncbi:MAG: uL15 family ribosomal protein [Candidatus Pacebacteria bacterium]|nr:uL15 family ribosomal protein [Candidatus Paceibacterota bacterium]